MIRRAAELPVLLLLDCRLTVGNQTSNAAGMDYPLFGTMVAAAIASTTNSIQLCSTREFEMAHYNLPLTTTTTAATTPETTTTATVPVMESTTSNNCHHQQQQTAAISSVDRSIRPPLVTLHVCCEY
jgi:hypothetical protein